MKRATMLVVILALTTLMSAQTPAAPAQRCRSGAGARKRPPQAKTQPEFDAYKAAAATTDPAAMEKAADDFAAKFPDSELRILLYKQAMHSYQSANKADQMMEMGRKVLKIDPDDPEALVGVSQVLAERTRDTDLDKDQRLDEGTKLAQHAIQTADTDIAVPPGTPQDKIDAYKGFLRSSAYYVLGTIRIHAGEVCGCGRLFPQIDRRFPVTARSARDTAPGSFSRQAGEISGSAEVRQPGGAVDGK